MPLRFDLIKSIIAHGANFVPGETVDPSTSPALSEAGVGVVTPYIEQLSLLELVRDPAPLFGANGGMWIGYELTDKGRQLATSETELRYAVSSLIDGPKSKASEDLASLLDECKKAKINDRYGDSFLKTIDEIRICFDAECYIAVISLCGTILETCLKEILLRHDAQLENNWMIGTLIKRIRQNIPEEYVDPALLNIANLINQSRIHVAHPQENIPVPSRDQASMVMYAVRDVVRRNLSHQ